MRGFYPGRGQLAATESGRWPQSEDEEELGLEKKKLGGSVWKNGVGSGRRESAEATSVRRLGGRVQKVGNEPAPGDNVAARQQDEEEMN
ncbi:hypothetical protein scyTo_0010037 [Scyliorhinus torazame]|uniref:Uncharacterized protein n=1 Tax=Scyliorhinus torazame TaxID=75743 RepID=A0A401NYQ4_SCYTO|nr:hypothetical protein [Scyliorhinus torazame]